MKALTIPEEQWLYGPDFDVDCFFRTPVLNEASTEMKSEILRVLGVEGPWASTEEVGCSELAQIDWTDLPVSYGLWRLSPQVTCGVKVIPDIRGTGYELRLAIPPGLVDQHWGPFPWIGRHWITEKVLQLHREVIDKCRALDSPCGLRAVLLGEESWTFSVPPGASGLFLHPEVAAAIGLKGKTDGRLFAASL